MRALRRAALTTALLLAAAGIQIVQSGAAQAALPTAAVALGDSFISGEGAGNYQPVVDANGTAQGFPGWSAPNNNAFFCHRSADASLFKANLPGIQDRFNLACSGGQPADVANASSARTNGRTVKSQLDQLRTVAQTHDIDVVLIGLGSNNSQFTFGDVATLCANRFIADAWTGWWEFWAYLGGDVPQEPCTVSDLASDAEVATGTAETVAAVRQILDTLGQVDADGQHKVVLQTYTNPCPRRRHAVSRRGRPHRHPRQVPRPRRRALRGRLPDPPRQPRPRPRLLREPGQPGQEHVHDPRG